MNAARVLVTGAGGYLGSQVVAALAQDDGAGRAGIRGGARRPRRPPTRLAGRRLRRRRHPRTRHRRRSLRGIASTPWCTWRRSSRRARQPARVRVRGRRQRHAQRAAGLRRRGRAHDRRLVERRGLRLPRRQPGLAHRGRCRSAATRSSPTRGTSAWSRRCWRTTASAHRSCEQVVLRIGTILGETVHNQITALFEKPRLLAIAGSDSPFVFIWDQDVVGRHRCAPCTAARPASTTSPATAR